MKPEPPIFVDGCKRVGVKVISTPFLTKWMSTNNLQQQRPSFKGRVTPRESRTREAC